MSEMVGLEFDPEPIVLILLCPLTGSGGVRHMLGSYCRVQLGSDRVTT